MQTNEKATASKISLESFNILGSDYLTNSNK